MPTQGEKFCAAADGDNIGTITVASGAECRNGFKILQCFHTDGWVHQRTQLINNRSVSYPQKFFHNKIPAALTAMYV